MKFVFVIIFLAPVVLQGQNKKTPSGEQAAAMLMALSRFTFSEDRQFAGKKILDTIYYHDTIIKAIGYYALDKNNKKSEYKVGLWREFYETGIVRSAGNYNIQYVLIAYSNNRSIIYNQYKTGEWIYYYDNAQVKAKGRYKIEKQPVATGVPGQFTKMPVTTDSWLFFNREGKLTKDKKEMAVELE